MYYNIIVLIGDEQLMSRDREIQKCRKEFSDK
jgi:hypothetical protein